MLHRFQLFLVIFLAISLQTSALASPWNLPQILGDHNSEIFFKVHAPVNILDGAANQVDGKIAIGADKNPSNLRADLSVQNLDYKAGLSVAGQLVRTWLISNPPTPASFVIARSTLDCTPKTLAKGKPCEGSVDGQLMIWAKEHTIDIPIEIKADGEDYLLLGEKKIKWGEYGFGDPESLLAKLKPVIELTFLIRLSY